MIFVGNKCRITRSTKLTVLHLLLGGWGRVGFVGGGENINKSEIICCFQLNMLSVSQTAWPAWLVHAAAASI